tara:strand:- start:593 stop:763 length:171 start_codon:yes stop_codon:yes gene_type:complete
MININTVEVVVECLLKVNDYEKAEKIVNDNLNDLEAVVDKLHKLKKEILKQETNTH